eukprot:571210-Pelagomonas_calceolata.AAC.2
MRSLGKAAVSVSLNACSFLYACPLMIREDAVLFSKGCAPLDVYMELVIAGLISLIKNSKSKQKQ